MVAPMVIASAPDQRSSLSTAPPFEPAAAGSPAASGGTVPHSATCGARSLVDRLRSSDVARPAVDPGLSGGLRAWLEDGLATKGLHGRNDGAPVVLGIPSLPATARDAHPGAAGTGSHVRPVRLAIARCLFRLALTVGLGPRPFEEALGALSVDDAGDHVVDAVGQMGREARARCREEALRHAALIDRQWRPALPGWLPRTADTLRAPLAGGAVVLSTTADLVLGAPSSGRASVCLVQVALDVPDVATGADRAFVALLETLRSGAAPFRVATYRPDCGRLHVEEVSDGLLASAVHGTLDRLAGRTGVRGTRAR